MTDTFAYEMNFCLDCQACETACPAGVKFGKLVETARVEVENHGYSSGVKSFFLKKIIPYKHRLHFAAKLLRFYRHSGIEKLLRSSGIPGKFFPRLAEVEQFTPEIPKRFSNSYIKEFNPPIQRASMTSSSTDALNSDVVPDEFSKVRYRLAFPVGCLMDILLPDVNKDTVELLNKLGALVISPARQTCCGSLNAHNGDMKTAAGLAKQNIEAFGRHKYDYLISNSAGCGAFMKEYGELFKDDPELADAAREFSSKVKDLTEFLSEIDLTFTKSSDDKEITYHDACHLVHSQNIFKQPRDILGKVPGINFIPLEDSTRCCGSAGIYNLVHTDTSLKLLEAKMENIRNSKAEVVLTGNPGCLLQIKFGVKKFNTDVRPEHPASFFNKLL